MTTQTDPAWSLSIAAIDVAGSYTLRAFGGRDPRP